MPRGNKGVPSYFSNLLGVPPRGLLSLRAPRQVLMSPSAEPATAGTRQVLTSVRPAALPLERPVTSDMVAPAVANRAQLSDQASPVPSGKGLPVELSLPDVQKSPFVQRADLLKDAATNNSVKPSHTAWPRQAPEQAMDSQASIPVDAPLPPTEQPLIGTILERATARYMQESDVSQPLQAPLPAVQNPVRQDQPAPANRLYNRTINQPSALKFVQPTAAEPTIEIGQIEVRIHPAPVRTPAPARAAARGPLTRSRYMHGLRQS